MKISNKIVFKIGVAFALLVVLYIGCTQYHNQFSPSATEQSVSLKNGTYPKVTFADACIKSGEKCLPNVILIMGQINQGTINAFNQFKITNKVMPESIVCLHSPGGSINKAFELAEQLASINAKTCFAESYKLKDDKNTTLDKTFCGSACNFLLLSASHRIGVGKDLNFITHAPGSDISFCFCTYTIPAFLPSSWILDKFVSSDSNTSKKEHLAFIQLTSTIPNKSFHKLSFDELLKYRIFDQYFGI